MRLATEAAPRRSRGRGQAAEAAPATWTEALERFKAHQVELEQSRHTIKGYADDLAWFGAWFARREGSEPVLGTITAQDLRDWKEHLLGATGTLLDGLTGPEGKRPRKRKHDARTVNRKLAALRAFLNWAAEKEWMSPVSFPKSCRLQKPVPKWLTAPDQRRLVREVDRHGTDRDQAMFHLFLGCGPRIAEMAGVEWDAIELSERKGYVTFIGKGRKQRRLKLDPETRKLMVKMWLGAVDVAAMGKADEWDRRKVLLEKKGVKATGRVWLGQRGPLSENAIWWIVSAYGTRVGLDLTPHQLRHSFCKRLAERRVPIEVIAALAGHESIEVTRQYIEPGQQDLDAAIDAGAADEE